MINERYTIGCEGSSVEVNNLTSDRRSANMRAVKAKNTKPEMLVRRIAHALGYRYRLHSGALPGKPDLVFSPRRKVIFVHGCFWHGHEDCRRAARPRSNVEFWNQKIARNIERDAAQLESLQVSGWRALIVWECETKDQVALEVRIRNFLENP
jgi:DNA mismatch endonuclease, patch repair protein